MTTESILAGEVAVGGGEEVRGHVGGWPYLRGAHAQPAIASSSLATVAGGGSAAVPARQLAAGCLGNGGSQRSGGEVRLGGGGG
jgi:hypothetical protein